jgi:uncharacterized protein YuzE
MTFSYDDDADVLYVTFQKTSSPVTYLENDNGDIIRFEVESGTVVGVTVPCFLERAGLGNISIEEIGSAPFNAAMSQLIAERTRHFKARHRA